MKKHFRDESHPWIKGIRFKDLTAPELLDRVGARPRLGAKPSAWIIDLDSTLFCVGPRIREIFRQFLNAHPKPKSEWQRLLPFLHASVQRYDIELTFREIFSAWDEARAAAAAAELWAEFEDFWRPRFFSSEHMHKDEAYPGAVDFVKRVLAQGFEVVYLSARDEPRTARGTLDALRASGFPLGGTAHLQLKPTVEEKDVVFKRRVSSVLRSRFEVVAFIDNEPENLVMAAKEFPRAEIVLYHTIMSDRMPTHDFKAFLDGREPIRLVSYEL